MPPLTLAHRNARAAILSILVAYACFSLGDALMKLLTQSYPLTLVLTVNGLVISALSVLCLGTMGQIHALWRSPQIRLHLVRSAVVAVLSYLSAFSIHHIPLPDFYGIVFLSPFLISLAAFAFLGEDVGMRRVIAMVFGFIGVIILAGPELGHFNIGYITTFAMLLVLVGHIMLVRRIGNKDPWPLYSFFPGFGLTLSGIWDAGSYIHMVPSLLVLPASSLALFALEALAVLGGQIGLARAYALAPLASVIAPYVYTQMLWGILYGWLLFHMAPPTTTWIGGGLIVASGLANFAFDRHQKRRRKA